MGRQKIKINQKALGTVETLYITFASVLQSTFLISPYKSYYSHLYCESTAIFFQHPWSKLSITELLQHLTNGFLKIICDRAKRIHVCKNSGLKKWP